MTFVRRRGIGCASLRILLAPGWFSSLKYRTSPALTISGSSTPTELRQSSAPRQSFVMRQSSARGSFGPCYGQFGNCGRCDRTRVCVCLCLCPQACVSGGSEGFNQAWNDSSCSSDDLSNLVSLDSYSSHMGLSIVRDSMPIGAMLIALIACTSYGSPAVHVQ